MNQQKMRELAFINEIVSLRPDLFPKPLAESESPDFLMQDHDKTIGIEMMEYVRGQDNKGSIIRRSETAQQTLANYAYQAFKEKHNEAIFVTLHCDPNIAPEKSKLRQLASVLVNIVEPNIPQDLYASVKLDYDDLQGTDLQSFLYSINIQRVKADGDGWGIMSASFISTTQEEIQNIINLKDSKVSSYLKQCNEIWLLVVAESYLALSGHISFTTDILKHNYRTNFNRVLFYDRATKQVHILNT